MEDTVQLHVVPAGGAASAVTQVYSDFRLDGRSTYQQVFNIVLLPGDSIRWEASGTGVNGYLSGAAEILYDMPVSVWTG
jgi:hypothetical protein